MLTVIRNRSLFNPLHRNNSIVDHDSLLYLSAYNE